MIALYYSQITIPLIQVHVVAPAETSINIILLIYVCMYSLYTICRYSSYTYVVVLLSSQTATDSPTSLCYDTVLLYHFDMIHLYIIVIPLGTTYLYIHMYLYCIPGGSRENHNYILSCTCIIMCISLMAF